MASELTGDLHRGAEANLPNHSVHIACAWTTADHKTKDTSGQPGAKTPEASRAEQAAAIAENEIAIVSPETLGLKLSNSEYKGLSGGYTAASEEAARRFREEIRNDNRRTKVLAEIRYRDAALDYLPPESSWWLRDKSGGIVDGWQGHDAKLGKADGYKKLDFTNPQFRRQVVEQAKATVESGAADGIMLDWYNPAGEKNPAFEKAREDLVTKIRTAIGPDKLVIVNSNSTELAPAVNKEINGYYMECFESTTPKQWQQITSTLDFAEKNTMLPHVNIVETWPDEGRGREQLSKMRLTTTLVATHAPDAAALFADADGTTQHEHGHDWYSFWDTDIGASAGPLMEKDGASTREYEKALAVSNPPGNHDVTFEFAQPKKSAATGEVSRNFLLHAGDGDFYENPAGAKTAQE